MLRALAITLWDEIESCVSFNECVASGVAQLNNAEIESNQILTKASWLAAKVKLFTEKL